MKYTRDEALKRIREFLARQHPQRRNHLSGRGATGIFCHGYDRWTVEQLRQLYPWLAKKMPPKRRRKNFSS